MVELKKGGKVSLTKGNPNLNRILVGLGWDPVDKPGRPNMDIDASVICIDSKGKEEEVVYFGHLTHSSRAIRHMGDNLTGDGDGDDEQIMIDLKAVPQDIERLSIIINIYEAKVRKQHFGDVENCFVHVMDRAKNDEELVRYDVSKSGEFNKQTGIFVADIYRYKGEWKFQAIGEGVKVCSISDMVAMKCN